MYAGFESVLGAKAVIPLELTAAVVVALGDDSAFDRWQQGEEVFKNATLHSWS